MSQDPIRGAYHGAAESWADAASLAYVPLARHLLENLGDRLPGPRALDAGAGTGAGGDLLRARGAEVFSVDLEHDMLAHRTGERGPAVVGDVARLPFRSASFDVVVAAFVLNHVADQTTVLRELKRVTGKGGAVLASVFAAERSPAKEAVDGTLADFGWTPPSWHLAVRERADQVGTISQFEAHARAAGLTDVRVRSTAVDVGLDEPEEIVRYRLGLGHAHEFLAALPAERRSALEEAATAAVRATGEPFRPQVLELVAGVS